MTHPFLILLLAAATIVSGQVYEEPEFLEMIEHPERQRRLHEKLPHAELEVHVLATEKARAVDVFAHVVERVR